MLKVHIATMRFWIFSLSLYGVKTLDFIPILNHLLHISIFTPGSSSETVFAWFLQEALKKTFRFPGSAFMDIDWVGPQSLHLYWAYKNDIDGLFIRRGLLKIREGIKVRFLSSYLPWYMTASEMCNYTFPTLKTLCL